MTIYYCDELADDSEDYVPMMNTSAKIISIDIAEAASIYEFQTRNLSSLQTDIDFILPTVMEMLSVKNEFGNKLDMFISHLMLEALDNSPPSYSESLRYMMSCNLTDWKDLENNGPEADLLMVDMFSSALERLGYCIYDQLKDVAYMNKYLAYNMYSYKNGFITMVVNYVPLLRNEPTNHSTIPTAKAVEHSINTVLSKYGKTLEFV